MEQVRVIKWASVEAPSEATIQRVLRQEQLSAYSWQNGPYDTYAAHSHSYNKVIYVLRGSITFGLPDEGDKLELHAGDRLELPSGVRHDAHVGPQGVVCLEAHC